MGLEKMFGRREKGPDWRTMSKEELIEIEKNTIREEISKLRSSADDLEKKIDTIAEARANTYEGNRPPYSAGYKRGPWKEEASELKTTR